MKVVSFKANGLIDSECECYEIVYTLLLMVWVGAGWSCGQATVNI